MAVPSLGFVEFIDFLGLTSTSHPSLSVPPVITWTTGTFPVSNDAVKTYVWDLILCLLEEVLPCSLTRTA